MSADATFLIGLIVGVALFLWLMIFDIDRMHSEMDDEADR